MRRPIILILILTIHSCSSKPKASAILTTKNDSIIVNDTIYATYVNHDPYPEVISKYNFNTHLRGNYSLLYTMDDSLQYLYFKKNTSDSFIKKLNECSIGLSQKNLGYPAVDFNDYFVLAHSFGSGNSHYIELINKTTGLNVLKPGVTWIDANKKEEVLLYCDVDIPTPNDSMTLYDVNTGQKKIINFPTDIFDEAEILNRIKIKHLDSKRLIIIYRTKSGTKIKMYSR